MDASPTQLWTLPELAAQAALALAGEDVEQSSGRVSGTPDARTIRYYTTLGLLDRPVHVKGRTAYYSRRHLMQLVAIKRMQARGIPLSQVQEKLLGITPSHLAQLARLGRAEEKVPPRSTGNRADFWKQEPRGIRVPTPDAAEDENHVHGVKLHRAVTVLLSPARRALVAADLEGLQAAAEPLLQFLRARQLIDDKESP